MIVAQNMCGSFVFTVITPIESISCKVIPLIIYFVYSYAGHKNSQKMATYNTLSIKFSYSLFLYSIRTELPTHEYEKSAYYLYDMLKSLLM